MTDAPRPRCPTPMLASALHVGRLVTWAVAFALLGGLPKLAFLLLPKEWAAQPLSIASGGKQISTGEVLHWAPDLLLFAAVVTAVVGAVFVFLHSLTVSAFESAGGEIERGVLLVEDAPGPARAFVQALRAGRVVVGLIGAGLILAGVPLFWMAVVDGDILDQIGLVKLITGGGAGLATAAAFYSHR